ncbi:hypothetical protein [Amaricoccus macauensis]|uniref:hypothetical protein n=1 Tax=Amaricoccus macauensis TaxID=57001 RepID=UPI003C7E116C
MVSAENISVHSVLFWQGRDPAPEQVARRLAELWHEENAGLGPFRIILGFRDQGQWLASRYAESGKDCPDFCQADFDLRVREILSRPQLGDALSWLDFSHVHARFARHFGRDNIHVYFLERLEAKPGWILEQIGRFIGGEVLGERFRSLGRQYRHDRRNVSARGENVWKLKSGQRSRLTLSPELADAIDARFSAGNHALRQELRQKHLDTARATGDSGPAP